MQELAGWPMIQTTANTARAGSLHVPSSQKDTWLQRGDHLPFTDEELELDPCDDPQGLGATRPKSRAVGGRLVSRQAAVASSRGGR